MSLNKRSFVLIPFCAIWFLFSFQGICCGQWTGQGLVGDGNQGGYSAKVAVDSSGNPWVVWYGNRRSDIFFTKWNGAGWDSVSKVNSPPSSRSNYKPSITIDENNIPWVAWHKEISSQNDEIYYSSWAETGWSEEQEVPTPNSQWNFTPKIASGGGNLWLAWYGGDDPNYARYKVFATHWNGVGWDSIVQVSPPDSGINWFADIAVGTQGRPHVVWAETWFARSIYYSMFDGATWTQPVGLNDPSTMPCAGWAAPSIGIDASGNLHVVWVGFDLATDTDQDIFYSASLDGITWSEPVMVNHDDELHDWYPDIAVTSPDNIWVVWHKELSFWEAYIYCSHFNGACWSEEERLDSDTSYCNHGPAITIDQDKNSWVFWHGWSVNDSACYIWNNTYQDTLNGIEDDNGVISNIPQEFFLSQNHPNPFNSKTKITYSLTSTSQVSIMIYNLLGQRIKTLVNEKKEVGNYVVT